MGFGTGVALGVGLALLAVALMLGLGLIAWCAVLDRALGYAHWLSRLWGWRR